MKKTIIGLALMTLAVGSVKADDLDKILRDPERAYRHGEIDRHTLNKIIQVREELKEEGKEGAE
jgi:hypothetical protein